MNVDDAFWIAMAVGMVFLSSSIARIWRGKPLPMKLDFVIIITGIGYVALSIYASYLILS